MWQVFARFAKIIGAWSFLSIGNNLFDNVLYPLVIYKWGALIGGGAMAITASIICLTLVCVYEIIGKDWLGVSVVEDIKTNGNEWIAKWDNKARKNHFWYVVRLFLYLPSRFFLIVLWAIKKNDVLAFIVLNINQDPFITTIFLRHGRFDGLRKRDWLIFCGSLVFSNGYWIARNVVLIEIIKFGWYQIT